MYLNKLIKAINIMDRKEVAEIIYEYLRKGNIEATLSLISNKIRREKTGKLHLTRTTMLNSIGQELGKLLIKEDWIAERLMDLWELGGREGKLITISAFGVISERDYENSKQFVLRVLATLSNWEICDQLALRVVAKLAIQNQKEIFSIMEQWLKSENKWIRRLAIATIPPFIRAREIESKICLGLLDKLMKEEDMDVKKAVGWALREVSKKDGKAVYEFLKKWAREPDKNTKWIVKEGMKKLNKEYQAELKILMSG